MSQPIPIPDNSAALHALQAMIQERTILAALETFNRDLGNIFQITLPGFTPIMMVGPEAARFVLVSSRGDLRWRSEGDPVTALLRRGVLVIDGEEHDSIRRTMNPALHKRMLICYGEAMLRGTDQVISAWKSGRSYDMLVEMRKIALLILIETLFKVDFTPDMRRLWQAILKTIEYISPGVWLISRHIPRFGYADALKRMDEYLYRLIRLRRQYIGDDDDLLGLLVSTPELDDGLIRDQLLTMLIAGHDTSTALLSWALYLLGQHPDIMQCVQDEVDQVLGDDIPTVENTAGLHYLDQVIDESLRLYPPIHLGSRVAAIDLDFNGYTIPAGTRVMYSIYLTHRLPEYWKNPHTFDPDRFAPENSKNRVPYTFLPFGGGPRNCIGAAFAQVESRIVLSRIFQLFDLELVKRSVHAHMGATLEPRPGVTMKVRRR